MTVSSILRNICSINRIDQISTDVSVDILTITLLLTECNLYSVRITSHNVTIHAWINFIFQEMTRSCEIIDPIRPHRFGGRRSAFWALKSQFRNRLKSKDSEKERAIILPLTVHISWYIMKQIYIDTLISVIISAFHSCHLAFETDLNGMHPRREDDAVGVLTFKAAVCVRHTHTHERRLYIRRLLCRYINTSTEPGQRAVSREMHARKGCFEKFHV